MTEKEESPRSVNEGTEAKKTLQSQALRYMGSYPPEQTLMDYAELLCWDICVTRRTAFESYILPMLKHRYLKFIGKSPYSGKSIYNFIDPNGEPDIESLKEYAKKHPHKNNDDSKQE